MRLFSLLFVLESNHVAIKLLVLLINDRISILDGSFCDMDAEDGPCAEKGDTWKPSLLP